MEQFIFESSIGFVVNRTATSLKNELWRAFKSNGYNITPEHWAVLNCLWQKEAQTQSEIAEKIYKDKTNLTRILDIMERNELIQRRSHETDRRSYRVFLTEKGQALKEKLIPIALEASQRSIKGLSGAECREVIRLMNIINDNLS